MPSRGRAPLFARSARSLLVAALALAYLAGSIGFPLPARLPAPVAGAGYACQGRGCGCDSADQCRQRCCCFPAPTAEEAESACPECGAAAAGTRWLSAVQERQCRGLATVWLSCGVSLPPPPLAAEAGTGIAPFCARPAPVPITHPADPAVPPPRAPRGASASVSDGGISAL